MGMNQKDKFYLICKRYSCFIQNIDNMFLEEILVKHVMLKAYEKHKEIDFQIFVKLCLANPIEYLYNLSEQLERSYYDLHLLNNCFNDKSAVHYGLKVDGTWYFITHSKNDFSLALYYTEFKIKPQDLDNISYLTTRYGAAPNILRHNVGQIKKRAIVEYNNLFLKKA
jgi:hypothetical protein